MLVKPFGNLLEAQRPTEDETFRGIVVDNLDPKKLGRIKVLISIYEDLDIDDIPWAFPELSTFLGNSQNSISFSVPEEGSEVRISFPTKDKNAPYYKGCELNEGNRCTFFDEGYPDCYGHKDSVGNFVRINKKTGITQLQHQSTVNVEILEDGTTTFTTPNGQFCTIDPKGNIIAECGSIAITGKGYFTYNNGSTDLSFEGGAVELKTKGPITLEPEGVTTIKGDLIVTGSISSEAAGSAVAFPLMGNPLVFSNGLLQ